MNDFRDHFEKKRGWWLEERATVPCIIPKDGLLAVFRREDVETMMDNKYPHGNNGSTKVWWFNDTKDREIAEVENGRVYANPQVLWEHFMGRTQ